MSNTFVQLTKPAGNGSGASVSTTALGAQKTITVGSSGGVYEPVTLVEMSNDGGTSWSPIVTFNGSGTTQVSVACSKMRMTISRFIDGVVPSVNVGAPTDTVNVVIPSVPAGNGSGAASDTSPLGAEWTVQVGGTFGGTVNIDISEDGVNFQTQFSFFAGSTSSLQTGVVTAKSVKVTRVGVPVVAPGTPVVAIAAATAGGGGGSGNGMRFQYTVTGLEADLTALVIALPSARASSTYLVFPAQEQATRQVTMSVDTASKTTTQFVLSLSGTASAGDIFSFYVDDKA